MQIINAVWEKRNLGLDCIEIQVEQGDDLRVIPELAVQTTQYQVLKVPSYLDFPTEEAEKIGFVFAEALIEMEHDLHVPVRPRVLQRLHDASTYRKMDETDYEQLISEVKAGMFSTDRIAKDPRFGEEVSARRYIGWLSDLREQKALFYTIRYKDDPIGFVVLQTKDGGKTYSSVLGGGYAKYRSSGTGIIQKEQEIVKKLGGKRLYTRVSSNNPGQLKALTINGYIPVGVEHVFIKHL